MTYLRPEPSVTPSPRGGRCAPRWVGAAIAVAGLQAAAIVLHATVDGLVATSLAIFCDLAGVMVLCWAAYIGVVGERRHQSVAAGQLEQLEAVVRNDRARIHEINATLAGIVSATQLLDGPYVIDESRRQELEVMIHREISRLDRIINPPPARVEVQTMDLDEHLGRLVLAHRARGSRVRWAPSGRSVMAVPDAFAQVLNTLLDNAARHGFGEASVTVGDLDGGLEIVVADSGPGIPADVVARLFTWGARGSESGGEGIGLTIARDLMVQQGGTLDARSSDVGAVFAIWLPTSVDDRGKLLLA